MSRINEQKVAQTFALLHEMGEIQAELETCRRLRKRTKWDWRLSVWQATKAEK